MKYYLELQYRRVLRSIRDQGINPYIGVLMGIALFIFMSIILFKKLAYSQWIYSLLALVVVIPFGDISRNEFLETIFSRGKYFCLRLLENIMGVFPFCLYLSVRGYYKLAILLLLISSFLSLFNKIAQPKFIIPSPFSGRPYEFTTGFRRTWLLFLFIYILTIISIYYRNFDLGIFSMLIVFLICCTFYSVNDPIFYVWIHAQTPKIFLLHKIKTGLFYSLWLSLIVAITLAIVWPDKVYLIMIVMVFGFLYLVLAILLVFVNYPGPSTLSHKIQVGVSMLFPPLTLFVIPNLYSQAMRRLNVYLKC